MKRQKSKSTQMNTLTKRAEELVSKNPSAVRKKPPGDNQNLIEDLQMHQIELEMQNEELRRSQMELESIRNKYSDLYEFAPVGYITFSENVLIVEANLTCSKMLGVERRFLIGKPFTQFVSGDTQDDFYLHCNKLLKTKTGQTCELGLVKKDGTQFYVQLDSNLIEEDPGGGHVSQIRTTLTDITRQKLAEKALWGKNHQLGNLVKELNCLYGIANIVDQDDISLEEIFQEVVDEIPSSWQFPENTCTRIIIQHKEWKTKNFQETIWKQASDIKVHGELRGILEVYCLEKQEINEDSFLKEKTYLINAVAQRLGKVIERRSDEEKLQESESQKRAILNASIDRIRYIDKDMKIIWANKTDRLEIGLLPKNIIGQFCYKICFGQDAPCEVCPAIRARETRQTEHAVIYSPGKDGGGETRCWSAYSVPLIDETNEISGFINVIRDITKQNEYENVLRQSEERFRKILENAPFGYFRIGSDGLWQYVNPEWERMHECSLQELVGKRFELMQPEDLKTQVCAIVHRAMAGETIKGGLQRRSKDGSFLYYFYNIQPVYQDSKIVAIEGFTNDLTSRKRVEDLVRNLSQKLLQAQEHERQMISYELHDSIAQNLSCMKISLDTFFKGYSDISPELIKKMKEFSNLTEQTIAAVRSLSYDLRPPGLKELGIVDALNVYCNEFYEKNGINVYFQPAGIDKLNMDIDTQVHLYRLIQEGLNNVRKHAGAGQVTIKLVGTPSNIILRIEDNGKGFDVKARERERLLNNEKRMGLRSMQERVNLLHGQMKIESSQMKGTRIFIQIPNLEQGHEPKEKHINY